MPSFEFTSPEGKSYTVAGPDGATKEQAFAMLQSQLGAPAAAIAPRKSSDGIPLAPGAAGRIAAESAARGPVAPEKTFATDSLHDKLYGPADALITMGSAMGLGAIAPAVGFAKSLFNGKDPEKNASDFAQANQWTPRTGTGRQLAELAGNALAPLGTLPTSELANLGNALSSGAAGARSVASGLPSRVAAPVNAITAPSALAQGAQDAAMAAGGTNKLMDLARTPKPAMAGVGAASTGEGLIRTQRAASLPVPIKLTQGQTTRAFDQVQFERETAKMPEGVPLQRRYAEQNQQLGQNLGAMADETGAEAAGAQAVGRSVVGALEEKQAAKKAEIKSAYTEARDAGQMQQPVDVTALTDFVNENRGKAKLAPIISTIESELKKNAQQTGGGSNALMMPEPKKTMMTIDASEDLRQAINKLSEPGTPNVVYGIEAKKIIDAATDGQGGPLYQQARRLHENYSNEFTNRDSIDSLLRNKPGTKDRAVAYEDVFQKSIIGGSLDDVRHVRRVLQTGGEGGEQAWKELQGATIEHIKDQMTSSVNINEAGNVVGSASKIDKLVRELDKDGKLDFIFGKKGAQAVRDVRDTALDIYTSPSGSVNTSNTASALVKALDKAASFGSSVPVVGYAVKAGANAIKSNMLSKKVDKSLNHLSTP